MNEDTVNNLEQIVTLRKTIEQHKGARALTRQKIRECSATIGLLTSQLEEQEQAREIIREVGLQTQQSLQYHISDIVTSALESVFADAYQLKVNFVQRRNKTECDLVFVRNGKEIEPLESSGFGAADVASFALRVAFWSMQFAKSRPVIILDEPLRFLDRRRQPAASKLLKELSERLGLQFIIVTHEEVLTQYADKIFEVSLVKDGDWYKSKVQQS